MVSTSTKGRCARRRVRELPPTLHAMGAVEAVWRGLVCVAWVLGRGVLVAAGTGANASTVAAYSREDLGATTLVLTEDEMARVGRAGERAAAARVVEA